MPWCPKCKLEYKDEFTECPDCHIPLVDELTETVTVSEIKFVTEDEAQRFVSFLKYSKFEKASYEFNSTTNLYELIVEETRAKEAIRLFKGFIIAEKEQELETEEKESDDTKKECNSCSSGSTVYVKQSERYSDFSSTGIMLLVIGFAGIIYVILNAVGVIHFISSILQYVLNTAIFVTAIWFGISSLKSANKIKEQISDEEAKEKQIQEWLVENITEEWASEHKSVAMSDEANLIRMMDAAKLLCQEELTDAPENMIDSLIEDHFLSIHI